MSSNVGKNVLLGKLFILLGPSGSGKTSIKRMFSERYPGFFYPISTTTRSPRKGEKNMLDYRFMDKLEFESLIEKDEFLEYAKVHGDKYYGTLKKEVLDAMASGAVVIKDMDVQGFSQVLKVLNKENIISVFINVPDREALKRRIKGRSSMTEEELSARMESMEKELEYLDKVDFVIDNDEGKLFDSVREFEKIVLDELEGMY